MPQIDQITNPTYLLFLAQDLAQGVHFVYDFLFRMHVQLGIDAAAMVASGIARHL